LKKHNNTVILFMILTLMLFILAACGNSGSGSLDNDDEIQTDGANQSDISQMGQNPEVAGNSPASAEDSQADDPSGFASVIVKSDNTVTDVEKQEVLNELESEIDTLVNILNQLDEVTESDLDY